VGNISFYGMNKFNNVPSSFDKSEPDIFCKLVALEGYRWGRQIETLIEKNILQEILDASVLLVPMPLLSLGSC
jgi:hypothetical protein